MYTIMTQPKQGQRGIVIVADAGLEILLPWWENNLRQHSELPIAIFDLGLSLYGKELAAHMGERCKLKHSLDFIALPKEVPPSCRRRWEAHWTLSLWKKRNAWFAKPFALLESPFLETLLLDIDCRIQGPLEPLFKYLDHPSGFAIVKHEFRDGFYHNSGVCLGKKDSPLIKAWAKECIRSSHQHMGDEDAIHHLILSEKVSPSFFPLTYNHPYLFSGGNEAKIQHFLGLQGKEKIFLDL